MPEIYIFIQEVFYMNIFKILGAIGAAALGAGAIIVAGKTGVGQSDKADDTTETPAADDNTTVCEDAAEEIVAEEIKEEAPAEE
jgi:hypothetical protein